MGYKLLLADDSITIQKVVSIIFASEGCELIIVDNGDAAVEKASKTAPDIMLIDTLMPGLSGYDVCSQIRKDPVLKNTPLLLLTGAFEPFDVEKARLSGADDFISKPFESQILVDKVKSLVELGKERNATAPVAAPPVFSPPVAASPWTFDTGAVPFFEQPVVDGEEAEASAFAETAWTEDSDDAEADLESGHPADAWGGFDAPAAEPVTVEPFAVGGVDETPFVEEAVEASPEDDLWGSFELETVIDNGADDTSEIVETYAVESASIPGEMDGYTFSEEHFSGLQESAPAEFTEESVTAWDMSELSAHAAAAPDVDEDKTGIADEPFAFLQSTAQDVPGSTEAEPVPQVDDFASAAAPFAEKYFFADTAEPALSAAAEPSSPSASLSGDPAQAPQSVASDISISQEQIEAVVSRIAREVIERVVWEVVPDLAETLIKEEIRRIKEGR